MYILTLGTTVKNARSLAYAKALAPQMFARLGTQVLYKTITITEQCGLGDRIGGRTVAIFNNKGWFDVVAGETTSAPSTTSISESTRHDVEAA